MKSIFAAVLLSILVSSTVVRADGRVVDVLYVQIERPSVATLSNLDPEPESLGTAGAMLAVADNNTTGQFLNYEFALQVESFEAGDILGAKAALAAYSGDYVLLDMSAQEQISLLEEADRTLFFNVRAYEDELRAEQCQKNLFHTIPSYGMRADALMQYALKKRWEDLVLVTGSKAEDKLFAEAVRRSAKKLGLDINQDLPWVFDADMRRHAGAEVPLFTQKLGDYDVMVIADENNDFARYVRYNTWLPRPVVGADGLRSLGWARSVEQWGAAQLQSRFSELAGRTMHEVDYAVWVALRSIDEALVRTKFADVDAVKAYLLDGIEVAGFKGRPLSFRQWNGQLRQPIALAHNSALVAMAPLEGFLHARNELDSLGIDEPQARCVLFGENK